ncbi:MAG: hypothetical protein R6W77_09400 [Trueperaceae bacterium]
MPLPDVWLLVGLAVLALLLAGWLSPLETLGWWAGWFGEPSPPTEPPPSQPGESVRSRTRRDLVRHLRPGVAARPTPRSFVVFLSGIHSVSGRAYTVRERNLLHRLRSRLPDAAVIEVFPYSVTNRALTGQRFFARFWRWSLRMKLRKRVLTSIAGMLINLRNLWQVAISADRRYGPLYNYGSAVLIRDALLANGYRVGSGAPVVLIGYSGGGQIALGAAAFLDDLIGVPVHVVGLGGVMSADPGALQVAKLVYLAGSADRLLRIGTAFFPGRWPVSRHSHWFNAERDGRIERVDMGPMAHVGPRGYLSSSMRLPDGRSHLEATVEVIAKVAENAKTAAASALNPGTSPTTPAVPG